MGDGRVPAISAISAISERIIHMSSMSIQGLTAQLNTDMEVLKNYLKAEKATGFTNAAKVIELMSIELFRAAGIANFTDANEVRGNHPAIDLFEKKQGAKGVSAQVTSTANLAKIKKTIAEFEKINKKAGHSLADEYEKLYILGLLSAKTDWSDCPDYCEVLGSDDIIGLIVRRGNPQAMHSAIDAIRSHQERSILISPYKDEQCLQVVLGVINRSAVKHYMSCEGRVENMLKGMEEISEVIGKGSVNGKSVSKGISEYADAKMISFLRSVLDVISQIMGIVNSASNGDHYYLDYYQQRDVDSLKEKIVAEVNEISVRFQLNANMKMVGNRR